jgi:hypothetical protein
MLAINRGLQMAHKGWLAASKCVLPSNKGLAEDENEIYPYKPLYVK